MSDRATLDDLMARMGLGDRDAFEELYRATSAKLFGVCLRVLKDRGDAEEVLQEVYIRVWNAAVRYRSGEASPMSWLITIARNRAVDRLRKRKPAPAQGVEGEDIVAGIEDDAPGPERLAMASDDRSRLLTCFGELPADRAEAVRRAYLDGDTYDELATRFGVPLNTMRTWLRRSLIKLRECLSR